MYDRFLTLRDSKGVECRIFDPPPPIASELVVGERYELALESALPRGAAFSGLAASEAAIGYEGVVLDRAWRPLNMDPLVYHPSFLETPWVLIQTSLGQLLMNPNELVTSITVGETLRWESTRLDLQAVIRRCDDEE